MVDLTLRMAADYIRKAGWSQNQLFNETGSPCLVGAIYSVAPALDATLIRAFRVVANRIGLDGDKLPADELLHWIARWNDEDGRTMAEVLAVLDPVFHQDEIQQIGHRDLVMV